MREIALAVRVENKDIINYLQMNIKSRLDFCKIIITNYCDNNFCYLLFACDKEFERICEEIIKEVIIEYIETIYKVEFLGMFGVTSGKVYDCWNEDLIVPIHKAF